MATFVLTDAFISVGGTDLSDHVRSITLDVGAELQDDTVMSDTFRSVAGGLKTVTVTVEWLQDFAASKVDATLYALLGTTTAIIIRSDSAVVSATNPSFTGTMTLGSYSPVTGTVGDMASAPSVFTGSGALVRAEA